MSLTDDRWNGIIIHRDPETGYCYVTALNHTVIAEWFLNTTPCVTVLETKKLLYYRDGIYHEGGEELVHRILVNALKPFTDFHGKSVYNDYVNKEVMKIIQGLTYTRTSDFDKNLNLINLKNGLLNWRAGEFKPHDPAYKCLIQIPITYDPEAACSDIEKMARNVLDPKDETKFYEFIAYCLYRDHSVIQKAFILLGVGKTGKSTLLELIRRFLGSPNTSSVSLSDMANDTFATSDLYGKSANICGDLDTNALPSTFTFKMLTSGKDQIRAQEKGVKAFDFINFAKFLFGSNKLPKTSDTTSGFFRRPEIILCSHVFKPEERDDAFVNRVINDEHELSGLLNKCIMLLPILLDRGAFTNQRTDEEAEELYIKMQDVEASFFDQFVVEEHGTFTQKDDLHLFYEHYCTKLGVKPKSMREFGTWILKNIDWIHSMSKNEQRATTTINKKSTAIWKNTKFNQEYFANWQKEEMGRRGN
jgi:putative DNA primase/helicase